MFSRPQKVKNSRMANRAAKGPQEEKKQNNKQHKLQLLSARQKGPEELFVPKYDCTCTPGALNEHIRLRGCTYWFAGVWDDARRLWSPLALPTVPPAASSAAVQLAEKWPPPWRDTDDVKCLETRTRTAQVWPCLNSSDRQASSPWPGTQARAYQDLLSPPSFSVTRTPQRLRWENVETSQRAECIADWRSKV